MIYKKAKSVTLGIMAALLLAVHLLLPALGKGWEKADAMRGNGSYDTRDEEHALSERTSPPERKLLSAKKRAAVNALAQDMILYHGCYGSKADKKVKQLLDAVSEIDGGEGLAWKRIMEQWDYVNAGMPINTSVPNGLPDGDNLCIVVLGYALRPDGGMSGELKGRLKTALACAEQYPNAWVICTGGGTAKFNKSVTEGGAMTEWMISHGVEKRRLLTERHSMTTTENAVFCHEILRKQCPQVDSVLLVTSSYHLPWGVLMFEAEFIRSAEEQNTPEIHVVSHCAYPTSSATYKKKEALRWQTGGLLELIGSRELADIFYGYRYRSYIRNHKPKL